MKICKPVNAQSNKRHLLRGRSAKYWTLLPIITLTMMLPNAQSSSITESLSASLSKRFIRFNEYLFNGAEETTAIAAVQGRANDHLVTG